MPYPWGNGLPIPIGQETGWASELICTQRVEEKYSFTVEDRTPVIQPVFRHYTD
jgi:hypothetical protein